jgi:Astacin (Peptidase family M12A)
VECASRGEFVPFTGGPNYVNFYVDPANSNACGSASAVGKAAWGNNQDIRITENCMSDLGAILHEMGHTAGLYHEHQRCDRDDYVYVNYPWWDASSGTNFGKICASDTIDAGTYDFSSLMGYLYSSPVTGGKPNYDPAWLYFYSNQLNNPPGGRFYSGD